MRRIRPDGGTIEIVFNFLYVKFIRELKRRGITDGASVEDFERFLVESRLVLPNEIRADQYLASAGGRTGTGTRPGAEPRNPLSPPEAQNAGGASASGGAENPKPPGQPTSIESGDKKLRKGRSGKPTT